MVKSVLIQFPDKLLEQVDALVKDGHYCSRSEVIRTAARKEVELRYELMDIFMRMRKKMQEHHKNDSRTPEQIARDNRDEIWNEFLKKAGGNERKAAYLFIEDAKKNANLKNFLNQ